MCWKRSRVALFLFERKKKKRYENTLAIITSLLTQLSAFTVMSDITKVPTRFGSTQRHQTSPLKLSFASIVFRYAYYAIALQSSSSSLFRGK